MKKTLIEQQLVAILDAYRRGPLRWRRSRPTGNGVTLESIARKVKAYERQNPSLEAHLTATLRHDDRARRIRRI